ncbi:hypothetical protein FDI40_gp093 [Agrobacterium phage Atu_ph07]|uniref:Uncharacterized protein n=1 Tax=Agrobacterium phage Atu_ph07 TaxID=2024264 RepID=A0A2L0UZD6_9CAUD|nr:hypothetical protein FDI40_gp093 [Agrobacterium phage Atu_ph07]AUZ94897.1 hypothetical protein [Agrobacterium phage Atu_ph07]
MVYINKVEAKMNEYSELVLNVWELVKDSVSASKREDVANKLVKVFSNAGADLEEVASDLHGEDAILDRILADYREEPEMDEEEEYDYDY